MDAPPNLERSASLTWGGMGGLNWDRNAVLSNVDGRQGKSTRAASFSARDTPSPPPPVSAVDALLAEEDDYDDLLPPPSLLKRSVTFSGDFPHDPDAEGLVATAPGLLGIGSPLIVQQRQRATSDAAAVKAAWGTNEPGSLSPDASIFSYSPSSLRHKVLPRRSHSMSVEPSVSSVWGPGLDSPRERSRTTHTLSVGSPDTEVLEYLDGDDLSFSRLPSHYSSPLQHSMYPSQSQQPQQQTLSSSQQPQRFLQTTSTMQQTTVQQQQQQQSQTLSGFNNTGTQQRLSNQTFASFVAQHPPSLSLSGSGPTASSPGSSPTEFHQDQNLIEAQLQNLQAMQQQWMHMMQMQFDQTLYATQQRLQNMHVSGGNAATSPGGKLPFSPPKGGKFPSPPHGYDVHDLPYNPQIGPMMYPSNNRPSTQTHRPNRRHENANNPVHNNSNNQGVTYSTSSLLAEHKITGRRPTAQELAGHVVEFSRDSHGSRLIQFKMETGTPEERRTFVDEALPHTLALARDLFGNYVVQNFFDNAAPDQRDMLALSLNGNVSALCTHPHGCRVVQRALFVVSPARRNDLIEELLELKNGANTDAVVRACARDAHATHVLQKAVASLQRAVGLKSAYRDPPVEEGAEDPPGERERAVAALERIEAIVLADCIPMSTHQQACRLVQRVLGACEPGKMSPRVTQIVAEVFRNIDALSIHQNGNFVLQHILEATDPSLASQAQNFVCTNVVRLARHKFGSHLVEKSLACATPAQVNAIIEKFLAPLTQDMLDELKDDFESSASDDIAAGLVPSTLPVLMKDPYANFVVQKAFDVARGELRAKLSQEIRARTNALSKFSYGRHILTHINRSGGGGTVPPSAQTE